MKHGTIIGFLRKNTDMPINLLQLVSTCIYCRVHLLTINQIHEAAKGAAYLHDQDIVHGDLRGVSMITSHSSFYVTEDSV
jgi:tRNA A-37 threonylcarbamoyl transferase component Bud32